MGIAHRAATYRMRSKRRRAHTAPSSKREKSENRTDIDRRTDGRIAASLYVPYHRAEGITKLFFLPLSGNPDILRRCRSILLRGPTKHKQPSPKSGIAVDLQA